MGVLDDQPADGVAGRGAHQAVARIGGGAQQAAGDPEGQGGLAQALGPGDQPGVVQAAPRPGVLEGGLGGLLADKVEDLARMGRGLAHPAASPGRPSRAARIRAST